MKAKDLITKAELELESDLYYQNLLMDDSTLGVRCSMAYKYGFITMSLATQIK